MIKLTLVFKEGGGRTLDDGYQFEDIHKDGLDKYTKLGSYKILDKNIKTLKDIGFISDSEKEELIKLKDNYRNPFSHSSNNFPLQNAYTTIYTFDLRDKDLQPKPSKVSVTGNPFLLINARRTYAKETAIIYFEKIISYIRCFDKRLHELYVKTSDESSGVDK
ncbi:hypothetical protein [Prevotella lacticifex]|uniref:hypothetical protein n=1 Tax=Prevotella lacticifex TaxID=2854755 RepID=UPI001CC51A1B|nr:hypothetical protein [Prevotella lacticifex]